MQQLLSRRNFLASSLAGAGCLATPFPAYALNQAEARSLVDDLVTQINRVIASGSSERAMFGEFEKIFKNYSDTSYIAAYAMGVDARRASAAQKKAFSRAFTGYISRKYGKRFREFIGGRLEIKDVRKVKSFYEVRTTAFLRGESPFEVAFHVSDRSGRNRFFNMYIEGINLLLTERTEIGAMIDKRRGNLDQMIADLSKAE